MFYNNPMRTNYFATDGTYVVHYTQMKQNTGKKEKKTKSYTCTLREGGLE